MTGWRLQGLRFVMVGLASNLMLYILYLLLTTLGIGPKLAMSLLFAVGTFQTFFFNKRWTFAHEGRLQTSFFKYVAVYGGAYLLNLTALMVFVDHFSLPHQVIQGVMILALALMLFLLQRYWVFRVPATA